MQPQVSGTYVVGTVENCWKIGYSVDVRRRLRILQCGAPVELEILRVFEANVEATLHEVLHQHRVRGEWFRAKWPVTRLLKIKFDPDLLPHSEQIVRRLGV